jgi:hypothetical protein
MENSLLQFLNISPHNIIFDMTLGFIMLLTYNFVNYNKLLENGITTIFSSFIIGYLYHYFMTLVPISFGLFFDYICIILSSIIVSYLVARIIHTTYIDKLFEILKIRRSVNYNIWADLLDSDDSIKLQITMPNKLQYIGFLGVFEDYTQTPVVSLYGYKIINTEDNTLVCDCSMIANRMIVLDTRKAESIEIIYGVSSSKIEPYRNFLVQVKDVAYSNKIVSKKTKKQ